MSLKQTIKETLELEYYELVAELLDTFYDSEDCNSFPAKTIESEDYDYENELYRYQRILDFHLSCENNESKTLKAKLATMLVKYRFFSDNNYDRADDIRCELVDTIDDLVENNLFTF